MAEHDMVIDNQGAPSARADINNALAALVSSNSKATAPTATFANMMWYDTTANQLKMRDEADAAWIVLFNLDQASAYANTVSAIIKAVAGGAGVGPDVHDSTDTKILDLQPANQADAEAATNNTLVMTPLRTRQASAFQAALLHVRDEKEGGTLGGTFTSGGWRTRDLQTAPTNEISGASLASNQITLPAGTYHIDGGSMAYRVSASKVRLYDTTGAANLLYGINNYNQSSAANAHIASVRGRFTISVESVLEIQHRCQTTKSSDGFGVLDGDTSSNKEVYSDYMIWKVA